MNSIRLQPNATYLLVGCLGGLGRSLTTWMIERGAKHFTFLSRSGIDNPKAANLIASIEAQGVIATVIRGDVTVKEDVQMCIERLDKKYPIRGVVQAAMVLDVRLTLSQQIWVITVADTWIFCYVLGRYLSEYEPRELENSNSS